MSLAELLREAAFSREEASGVQLYAVPTTALRRAGMPFCEAPMMALSCPYNRTARDNRKG